ncbi:FAD-dependent oxidoreductase [bacterium 210820-DFI.6.37]|nr:FAD-dependent oxidoreductase [bacterium 210820-DFI.6.37]
MKNQTLFSPIRIGSLTLKNRAVMAPMELGFCNETKGLINQQMIEFFRLRAKGGPGLIIVGGGQIDPVNYTDRDMVCVSDDSAMKGLKQLTDTIHEEDCGVFLQLMHSGRYAPSSLYHGVGPVAPSPVPSRLTGETPHELSPDEIRRLIGLYAAASLRAKNCGFDGIELCANSGYLIGEFLSPLTNQRTDRYGGDLSGRMTFLREIIAAVQAAAGSDFPLGVRIGGNDFMAGGNQLDDAVYIAKELEKLGVSLISVTGGWHETSVPQVTMDVPPGTFSYLGAAIHQAVSVPVAMSNRLDMKTAQQLVEEDIADLAAMARPFLADPSCVRKAENGDFDSIRPCLGCNQGCLDNIMRHRPVKCLANPLAGREAELMKNGLPPERGQAAAPQRLLVIGAGPAGMEFALTAAKRGYKVAVWEAGKEAGGQLNLAAAPPGRQDFKKLVHYLYQSCLDQGVQFCFETKAEKKTLARQLKTGAFDRVILATGARPIQPPFPQDPEADILQAWDVLAGKARTGKTVLIIGGGAVGVETALYLSQIGTLTPRQLAFLFLNKAESEDRLRKLLTQGNKQIILVEMEHKIGKDIGITSRWGMLSRLKQAGVRILTDTRVTRVTSHGADLTLPDGSAQHIDAETIVLAAGSRPHSHLLKELEEFSDRVTVLGDAGGPAKAMDAVFQGYEAALALD